MKKSNSRLALPGGCFYRENKMSDMLVKLYEVQPDYELENKLRREGITIKRALGLDKTPILQFVRENFSQQWADECEMGLIQEGCYIAVYEKQVVGFACFDATMKDYFGPTGVRQDMRGKGIGKALLLKCLHSMHERGYNYAIIGWVGPAEFYQKACGATIIPDSTPRSYGRKISVDS